MPKLYDANITPPRVAFIDPRTGTIARAWYLFFLQLFQGVENSASNETVEVLAALVESQPRDELGTLSYQNADDVDITGGHAKLDYLDFNETVAPPVNFESARLWWNATGTLNVGMGNGNITQQVGEELYIYGEAKEAITQGQVITRSSGTASDPNGEKVPRFEPAPIGTTDIESIIGIATEDIAKNAFGRITYFGVVHDIDTSGLGDGSAIWYDPTVLGGFTIVKPTAPNMKFHLGNVIKAAAAPNGSVLVNLTPGSVLGGTDSNVQITTPTNNSLLQYYSAGGYWRNVDISNVFTILQTKQDGSTSLANSANNNVVIPTNAGFISFTGGGASCQLNSMVAAQNGQRVVIYNNTGSAIIVAHDTGGAAANRIYTPNATNLTWYDLGCLEFIYSTAASRWLILQPA